MKFAILRPGDTAPEVSGVEAAEITRSVSFIPVIPIPTGEQWDMQLFILLVGLQL
ncbi:MAG: hypothetical protein ACI4P8_05900 [Akkermansia sp.]